MADQSSLHEDLSKHQEVRPGSDRGFGITFAVVFTLVALFPVLSGGGVRLWALVVGAGFLGASLAAPAALAPLNRLWFRFGLLLGRIMTPVVMGLLFFATVTPTAFLMRAFGKNPLRLGFEPAAASYWIPREPPGPAPESLRKQF